LAFSITMTTATQISRERDTLNVWDKFLDLIKSRVSINTYSTWFQPTRLNRVEGELLYVQIPSTVFRQVLTRTYGEIVKAVFHQMGTPTMKVQYVCTEEEPVQATPAISSAVQTAVLGCSRSSRRKTDPVLLGLLLEVALCFMIGDRHAIDQ
jgi:chromosomal replication initiation ATPase DnaA